MFSSEPNQPEVEPASVNGGDFEGVRDVACWLLPDIEPPPNDVRYTPNFRHQSRDARFQSVDVRC